MNIQASEKADGLVYSYNTLALVLTKLKGLCDGRKIELLHINRVQILVASKHQYVTLPVSDYNCQL